MNKTVLTIITLGLVVMLVIIFTGKEKTPAKNNVEIRDGIQYVTVNARGGYSPQLSAATAGIPTKLIMETSGSYDCSISLVIPSIGYQKILPQTGKTEIDLGTPKAGTPLEGVCGMGMYSFAIDFN